MATNREQAAGWTGVGSMPGTNVHEAVRIAVDECSELVFLPELPGRGVTAGMIGRTAALLVGLGVDLQPAGWRLTDASGIDHRRASSLLAEDLDALEEHTQSYEGPLKVQVVGPWTLAAAVERPRGDKVLGDHGARRELAESLAEGLREHVGDVRRRTPDAEIVVQIDEPSLPAVLAGSISTASGFHRHRTIDAPAADQALRWVTDAVRDAGATPVAHVCARDVPIALLAGAGFAACGFDLSYVESGVLDPWAEAFESGVDLWPGVIPTHEPDSPFSDADAVRRLEAFLSALGFGPEQYAGRLTVTPTCGLAGASPSWAGRALAASRKVAAGLAG
ncbi:uroporphyrinogen decarboxylase/cobalamine-independent methonine synthase family protein [Solicola gregarius]|uniref:Methionine synthase n=1 Tax=Solicola gregarius TaxID=2908642 RepID=A0AA46TJ71_9ACTN|nr:methionine synthase [Solicola gregarius]UYM05854.1 methionine synthase [Solicola gregarius]